MDQQQPPDPAQRQSATLRLEALDVHDAGGGASGYVAATDGGYGCVDPNLYARASVSGVVEFVGCVLIASFSDAYSTYCHNLNQV